MSETATPGRAPYPSTTEPEAGTLIETRGGVHLRVFANEGKKSLQIWIDTPSLHLVLWLERTEALRLVDRLLATMFGQPPLQQGAGNAATVERTVFGPVGNTGDRHASETLCTCSACGTYYNPIRCVDTQAGYCPDCERLYARENH